MGVSLFPAISQSLWGQLYGWLPLSNAYGISSGEKQPISIILRLFLALENKAHSMYIGIFLHHKTKYIQCTSAFPCITKQNTSNVHLLFLVFQNNTYSMYIRIFSHFKIHLYLPGFHSVVKQNTTNGISSICNLTIRIRIMKTKTRSIVLPNHRIRRGNNDSTVLYFI